MRIVKYLLIGIASIFFVTVGNAQEWQWSEPVPLDSLNTLYGEAYAYLSTDGRFLFWNASGQICMSRRDGDTWGPREILPEPVNSEYLENAVAITPDNSHIYWVSWRPDCFGTWDIWRCSWDEENNIFGEAECLGENINSPDMEFGMCFTPDGKRIFFVTDTYIKNGQYGYGGFDLWYCDWDSTLDDWGLPYNAGAIINSVGWEYTPYISRVGIMINYSLFFSTDHWHHAPGWQGITDILCASWDGQEWGNLENIGIPINSPVEDWSPCVSQDGRTLYFVTRRDRAPNGDMELMVSYREPTYVEDNPNINVPTELDIQIYPNPFNMNCKIIIEPIDSNELVHIRIIDLLGKEVKNLGKFKLNGSQAIIWDGTDNQGAKVTTGVYFAVLEHDKNKVAKQFILLK